jgi:hypothetical protein
MCAGLRWPATTELLLKTGCLHMGSTAVLGSVPALCSSPHFPFPTRSSPPPVSIPSFILIGILCIAIASLLALIHAVTHAEEGYEDANGYHRNAPSEPAINHPAATVDTGTPWDQLNGSSCPWSFKPTLGHNDFPAHQP